MQSGCERDIREKVRFVFEVGSNYDGSLERAFEYIQAAADAGATYVKFQTLQKKLLIAEKIWQAGKWVPNPVNDIFASGELPAEWHFELKKKADECGIEFMSTPFYLEAVDLLERVGVKTYKIASGDITFRPLLEAVGRTGKRVLLGTGCSSLPDVERAVKTLQRAGAGEIVLLHCVSNYPPQWNEMNLRAVETLQREFGLPVGISDHTPGAIVPLAVVALGGTYIEKHVTFDRSSEGPDHPFAITVEEFGAMVRDVRHLEQALGSGKKIPCESEKAKLHRIRRGVYDSTSGVALPKGEGIWLRPEYPDYLEYIKAEKGAL